MKAALRIFLASLFAVGLGIALTQVSRSTKSNPAIEETARPNLPPPPDNLNSSAGQSQDGRPQELTRPDSGSSPSRAAEHQSSTEWKSPADLASLYAKTMQTGVFGEEAMPQFAEVYLFPTEEARKAAAAANDEFFGSPIDQWSSRMEEQLRSFFGQHPLITNPHLSIMCRSTQCRIQFVERTVPGQPEGALGPSSLLMMAGASREPWFRENFGDWKTQAATPVSAEVTYQLVVLPRRLPQP
jgi:hypothetical protein